MPKASLWKNISGTIVAETISPWNNEDDNSIDKERYAVKQKMPNEKEASSNN